MAANFNIARRSYMPHNSQDIWQNCYESEEWRPVVGMEIFYEVSNLGRVRSKHLQGRPTKNGILAQTPNKKGYLRIHLSGGGKDFSRVVHRLVLEAFHGGQPSCIHECNHKDGRKRNNIESNLEWVTPVENNAHSVINGLWRPHIGEAHGRAILTESDVRRIRAVAGTVTNRFLAKQYGVNPVTIAKVIRRENWRHVE